MDACIRADHGQDSENQLNGMRRALCAYEHCLEHLSKRELAGEKLAEIWLKAVTPEKDKLQELARSSISNSINSQELESQLKQTLLWKTITTYGLLVEDAKNMNKIGGGLRFKGSADLQKLFSEDNMPLPFACEVFDKKFSWSSPSERDEFFNLMLQVRNSVEPEYSQDPMYT